jgi:hypothetical protein
VLLLRLAQGNQMTHCTAIDVATHVLQSKHGRELKDARQKEMFHKGYLNMLKRGYNNVTEGHDT